MVELKTNLTKYRRTVVRSLDILYESYQDPKFRCCPLLRKMVDAGLLGKKSGKGFYTY